MEAPSKMTPSVNFFKGGTNASNPVSSFKTKAMRHISHSSAPPPTRHQEKTTIKEMKKKMKCYHTHKKIDVY